MPLEDFDKIDCILIFGQNPGTNSPRMMTTLRDASRRGAAIISFNPFRERALERFQAPQNPIEMATLTSTPISSSLYQVRVGGDVAVLKGLMKVLIEADEAARAAHQITILDWDFIRGHTTGIESLVADLKKTRWKDLEQRSGLSRADIESVAHIYMKAERAIVVYGMGLTQHATAHAIPRSPGQALRLPATDAHGHNVVTALCAMVNGYARVFFGMGGNIVAAIPDWPVTHDAFRNLALNAKVSERQQTRGFLSISTGTRN